MPEIGALLHDAVPPDGSQPDLDEIAHRAGRRRRHRRLTRVAVPLAAVAVAASGLLVLGGDDGPPDVNDDVVVTGDTTTSTATTSTTVAAPSAAGLARLLGTRPLLATTRYVTWPLTPDQFFEPFPPDQAVVGTLAEVRPGPVLQDGICHDTPEINGCVDRESIETVVDVERWLAPGGPPPGRLAVPWPVAAVPIGADQGQAEEATRRAAQPYQGAAPIGARVLVLLKADDGPHPWVPSAVSAIVIEDGAGVAVPEADPTRAHQAIDFDDYIARVEALLR
jgi:hypothetical protein